MTVRGCVWFLFLAVSCVPVVVGADPVAVTGVVLGPDGGPVAGARVGGWANSADDGVAEAVTTADEEGRFALTLDPTAPVDSIYVAAVAPGLVIGGAEVAPGAEMIVRLGAGPVEITGAVIGPDRQPIAGVRVSLDTVISDQVTTGELPCLILASELLAATTDAAGQYTVGNLPADGWVTFMVEADGFARPDPSLDLTEAKRLDLVLSTEAILSGRVLHDGQPVAGATVAANQLQQRSFEFLGRGQTVTDDEGRFEIKGLGNGLYTVQVKPPPDLAPAKVEDILLTLGQRTEMADLVLTPGAVLRGTVTVVGTDEPLPGFRVTAMLSGLPASTLLGVSARTDVNGRYEFRVPPGKARVHLEARGGYASEDPVPRGLEVAEGQTVTDLDFRAVPPAVVRGVVLGPDGQPAPGAELLWTFPGVIGMSPRPLDLAPDGSFELLPNTTLALRAGGLALMARQAELDLFAYVQVARDAEQVEVRLQPAAYAVVRVVDTADRPLKERPFRVVGWDNGFRAPADDTMFLTDAEGMARLGPLPPEVKLNVVAHGDQYDYLVNTEEWGRASTVTLEPGETRELPALVQNLVGRLVRVWVGDAQGHSVAGALLSVGQRDQALRTDREGWVSVRLPLRNPVGIVAMDPIAPLFAAMLVDPLEGDELLLTLHQPCEAQGQVVGADGVPLAGLWLHFTPTSAMSFWGMYRHRLFTDRIPSLNEGSVRTDENGRWRTTRFLSGMTYQVQASRTSTGIKVDLGTFDAVGSWIADTGVTTYRDRP